METLFKYIVTAFQMSHDLVYVFGFIVAGFLLLSGLDDLTVDLYYWFNRIFRRKKVMQYQKLPVAKMEEPREKPIAVFIPTWQEESVIKLMLKKNVRDPRVRKL
ncbi:MAG: hypothetical protein KAJ12_08515 [Bacteroidetes bacterium]|nr:hypothetical protein [Bacteroidota bacterium]